jgi:hypothetical protein
LSLSEGFSNLPSYAYIISMEKEYFRPKEIEAVFGIKAVTVRYYFKIGVLKGAKVMGSLLINARDLREKIQRVEAGEPSQIVFSSRSNLVITSKIKGGNDDL